MRRRCAGFARRRLRRLIVMPLDRRFQWSAPIPDALRIVGMAGSLVAFVFIFRAMLANRFFSAVIRIQDDRGHRVVDRGPYAVISPSRLRRHDHRRAADGQSRFAVVGIRDRDDLRCRSSRIACQSKIGSCRRICRGTRTTRRA